MKSRVKSWVFNLLKVGIAVGGLYLVLHKVHLNDRVTIEKGHELRPAQALVKFLEPVDVEVVEDSSKPTSGPTLTVRLPDEPVKVEVDGRAQQLRLTDPALGFPPTLEISKDWLVPAPNSREPKIEVGMRNLVKMADIRLLLASWAMLGIPFIVTAWRWQKLMVPQGIRLPYGKCLALTFVGQFYSTFLPGTTSGDLVKIIYTSRVVGSKTKSTVTVLLDRVIGLIALMVIAGIAAAFQYQGNPTMLRVMLFVAAALLALSLGTLAYFSHRLRQLTGLERLLNLSFVPDFVRHADEVLHTYRTHWRTLVWAFALGLMAQAAIPISAWFAGMALHIDHANLGHYLAYTPLAILAAALPISFLGLGVMDSVLFNFFCLKGLADATQTFALAQTIRFFPVMWNMFGAFWVVTGQYSRHVPAGEAEGGKGASDGLDHSGVELPR